MELGTELPPLGRASFLLLREEGWLGWTQMEEPGAQGRGTERRWEQANWCYTRLLGHRVMNTVLMTEREAEA